MKKITDFMTLVCLELDRILVPAMTENGAVGFSGSGKPLVDITYQIPSYRTDKVSALHLFWKAFTLNAIMAMKWLFFVRDPRQGLGERDLFRVLFFNILQKAKFTDKDYEYFFSLIEEYGRWDDILPALHIKALKPIAVKIINKQLVKDLDAITANKPVSLLAKWLPSVNTSSGSTRKTARILAADLGFSEKDYRVMLSDLRRYIGVCEKHMSAKEWNVINYEHVPSKANIRYSKAFARNDTERRQLYIKDLVEGKKKINASVVFPHEILHALLEASHTDRDQISLYEEMWKYLPNKNISNTMVVADGSGSMLTNNIGNTKITALEVANALAIYCSERNSDVYKDKYITFSEHPQFVDFGHCNTLLDKYRYAQDYNEVANTNIEAVFKLILDTAKHNDVKQEDLPARILIISDMEFDEGTSGRTDISLFHEIQENYEEHGYTLPKLIFWNVNSRTNVIPITEAENGVCLVSGFSVNTLDMVMSDKLDPEAVLLETLNKERYDKVIIPSLLAE